MYPGVIFVLIHFLGILYVLISTGVDCARREYYIGTKPKRRAARACNILVLYHMFLSAAAVVLGIVYDTNETDSENRRNSTIFVLLWLSAAANYSFSLLVLAVCATFSQYFYGYKKSGCIHAGHVFELLTFILFWSSIGLMVICQQRECVELPPLLYKYADALFGLAAILLFTFYLILLSLAIWNTYADKLISKEEAVDRIKQRIQEQVFIGWMLRCGHTEGNICSDQYVEKHRETKRDTFTTSVETYPFETPSHTLLTSNLTHLYITTSVCPVNKEMYSEILSHREEFKSTHVGHDKLLDINTLRCKGEDWESYLVSNETDLMPFRLHSLTQWTFAVVGLSLPYRLLLYMSMGHVRYKIKKRIDGNLAPSVSNGREDRVFTVEGSPPPYTPQQFSVPDRPPDYHSVVAQPKDDPPPYNTVT